MKLPLSVILFIIPIFLPAQVPVTELYLFDVRKEGVTYHVHSPKHLSAFNPGGYNNHPYFATNDLLFLSVKYPDSSQHDLLALEINTGSYYPISRTRVNEFSPGYVPGTTHISYVRQDQHAGEKDQQLFVYDPEEDEIASPVLPRIKDLGYYCWLNEKQVALFLDQEIPKLAFANTADQQFKVFSSNVGRCLTRGQDGKLYFVHKYTEDYWHLKSYDSDQQRSEIITETLKGAEDFAIAPDGSIFQGKGSKLYVFNPQNSKEWIEVFDLAVFGIHHVSRLAINEQFQLALVDVKSEE